MAMCRPIRQHCAVNNNWSHWDRLAKRASHCMTETPWLEVVCQPATNHISGHFSVQLYTRYKHISPLHGDLLLYLMSMDYDFFLYKQRLLTLWLTGGWKDQCALSVYDNWLFLAGLWQSLACWVLPTTFEPSFLRGALVFVSLESVMCPSANDIIQTGTSPAWYANTAICSRCKPAHINGLRTVLQGFWKIQNYTRSQVSRWQ